MAHRLAREAAVATVAALLAGGTVWQQWPDSETEQVEAVQQMLVADVPRGPLNVRPPSPQDGSDQGPPPSATSVKRGEALAVMEIPRFGDGWEWTALEGVALPVIDHGPGHYPGTALPGEKGNTVFAAHRAGHGDPFLDFDLLRPGDKVEFRQGSTVWVYRLSTRPEIIEPDEVWVLDRLPGRQMTLTTCWPKYGSEKRMYVQGRFIDTRSSP